MNVVLVSRQVAKPFRPRERETGRTNRGVTLVETVSYDGFQAPWPDAQSVLFAEPLWSKA